ncbi:DNA-formamidopyrimidine glycosylase family protein, partial [Bordetella pertussis]|uniref:DNA-formamidopyrimidine glycosylase family protein n=1 Tax=Bordetella pertussis TaxID=520 RepID=UPI00291C5338
MPELPEVETTRRGIDTVITGRTLRRLVVREARMRWPIPPALPDLLAGRTVLECGRRGKYLLLRFDHGVQIVHLGMSGSLRRVPEQEAPRKHDHVDWVFDHAVLRLHDPRRFGAVLWHPDEAGPIAAHPLLARLGIEPFDPRFAESLFRAGIDPRTAAQRVSAARCDRLAAA